MRFLIVDDEESIRFLLPKYLNGYGESVVAANGFEAISALSDALSKGEHFDAVFMDIMMPGMDGHEAAVKMREMEQEAGVEADKVFKLVMLSAVDDVESMNKAFLDEYASCYILKPLRKTAILDELRINKIVF